jgi:hypothetical protein
MDDNCDIDHNNESDRNYYVNHNRNHDCPDDCDVNICCDSDFNS